MSAVDQRPEEHRAVHTAGLHDAQLLERGELALEETDGVATQEGCDREAELVDQPVPEQVAVERRSALAEHHPDAVSPQGAECSREIDAVGSRREQLDMRREIDDAL